MYTLGGGEVAVIAKARRRDGGAHATMWSFLVILDCELTYLTWRTAKVLQRYHMFRLVSASLLTNAACASTSQYWRAAGRARCLYANVRMYRNPPWYYYRASGYMVGIL